MHSRLRYRPRRAGNRLTPEKEERFSIRKFLGWLFSYRQLELFGGLRRSSLDALFAWLAPAFQARGRSLIASRSSLMEHRMSISDPFNPTVFCPKFLSSSASISRLARAMAFPGR